MKPTIWIFSLEPIETRYTAHWHEHIPKLLNDKLGKDFNVVQVDGIQKNSQLTPGAFLNFSDTNYWKSSQLCKFLEHHNNGETTLNDHILFTDAWNPVVIQLKYMKELLGFNWTLHGLFHAGSYDPQDFLGRLIGDEPWVRNAEFSFFYCFDHNYFATEFHIEMFCNNLLDSDVAGIKEYHPQRIIRTGWPMEYTRDILFPYKNLTKRDLILFPHRIAPEKQVEIFRDLKLQLPQYEFVICQDQKLSKHEYHTLLGEAKVVFSANLQETLGIGMFEGAVVGAIPMVPDRLSYSEMYFDDFKYPSEWTEDWNSYIRYRSRLLNVITNHISSYETYSHQLHQQTELLYQQFFSANELLENFKLALTIPK